MKRLRAGLAPALIEFMEECYPKTKGPGWMRRDQDRAIILRVIEHLQEAAEEPIPGHV